MSGREDPRSDDWPGALITAGTLMVTLCGLCSGLVFSGGNAESDLVTSFFPFLGGAPILVGVALIIAGLVRQRRGSTPKRKRGHIVHRIASSAVMVTGGIVSAIAGAMLIGVIAEAVNGVWQGGRMLFDLVMPAGMLGLFTLAGVGLFRAGKTMWK